MPDTSRLVRQIFRYAAITAAAVIAAGVALTLGPGAGWVLRYVDGVHGLQGKELEDALDAVRGRALALGTGLAALVAVYYTARNADTARKTLQHNVDSAARTAAISEQGQVTERYTKAIEQLGSNKLEIRLGGIYALERIAADSARDHPTVMEVLSTFIRENTATPGKKSQKFTHPAADIQAALTVIGRRTTSQDTRTIDLSHSNLPWANLVGANLRGAHLSYTDLSNADLSGADLSKAKLGGVFIVGVLHTGMDNDREGGADLSGADLSGANLRGANLRVVDLSRASLDGADLSGADLSGADLIATGLRNVNLSGADLTLTGLSDHADVNSAHFDEKTRWPLGFDPPQ